MQPLAALLAGGKGSRMGGGKATSLLGGRALIEYPLAAIADSGVEAVVVAKAGSELPPLDIELWQEPDQPTHPLLGIVTAMQRSQGRPLIVCACDLPFVPGALIEHLAQLDVPLAVPEFGDRLHPLLARYEASLLDELEQALAAERSLHETIGSLDPHLLAGDQLARFGDPRRTLFNVNGAGDLERAEQLLRES